MKISQLILILTLFGATFNAVAGCAFLPGNGGNGATLMDLPRFLTVPRDTPNGTVLYESPPITFNGSDTFECDVSRPWGIKNLLGTDAITSDAFPIGDSGIAWRFLYSEGKTPIKGYGAHYVVVGVRSFSGTSNVLQLIKAGDIEGGTFIPAGDLGYMKVDKMRVFTIRSTQSAAIVSRSCETPNVKVEMGEHDLSDFPKGGSYSSATNFKIEVNNCPTGINKITYNLTPAATAPALILSQGIIALNRSSTAKGIALQIIDSNQRPIELGKTYVFNGYSTAGGNFSIPLAARYLRTLTTSGAGELDPGMSAGSANTEVTFIMSYL